MTTFNGGSNVLRPDFHRAARSLHNELAASMTSPPTNDVTHATENSDGRVLSVHLGGTLR